MLDAMIASHNDHDHYGGLDDLLDVAQEDELDAEGVSIEQFFHAGLSWWRGSNGSRTLGETEPDDEGEKYFVQLLDDRASAEAATDGGENQLQGAWGKFIAKVVQARTSDGRPTPIGRLSHLSEELPGFTQGDGDVVVKVLAPVEKSVGGRPGLQKLGGDSVSTNGHSVLLRLDYGKARILITGDLNKASQQALLREFEGNEDIFSCDVAKSCHHGSEDVSFTFLQAMKPGATVISSGDAEGHDHPRPRIVAASGATGHVTFKDDQMLTPLVYSTELARSLLLGKISSITLPDGSEVAGDQLGELSAKCKVHKPGSLRPENAERSLKNGFLVTGLTYGLVNVRTDGKTILCATMNEGRGDWTVKTFKARFG